MSKTLKSLAFEYIRERMLMGEIQEGARISDVEISREMGISRTPVREAIVQLETKGLVEQLPGQGPRVRTLNRRDLEECFELREILECGAVVMAAQRVTDKELASLDQDCEGYDAVCIRLRDQAIEEPTSPWSDHLNVLDMSFHLKIIKAAKNVQLLGVVRDLHLLTRILRRRSNLPSTPYLERLDRIRNDHRRILAAIRARDGVAASDAMRRHIQWAMEYHLKAFDWERRRLDAEEGGGDEIEFPLNVVKALLKLEESADETTQHESETE